jgi:hypothetical protein
MEKTDWLLSFEKKGDTPLTITFFGKTRVSLKWLASILVAGASPYLYKQFF